METLTKKPVNPNSHRATRVLAEIAIFTALATVLSLIIIYPGGSITLASMVPILWLALRRGPIIGLLTGVLYGIIQFMLLPYAVDPIQLLLDYPLAFGVLGLAGFFQKNPIVGAIVGVAGRFVMHFISGVFYWAPISAPLVDPFVYSSIYNGSYLLPELVISGVILYLLQKSKVLRVYL
jgi:thiamine transporter